MGVGWFGVSGVVGAFAVLQLGACTLFQEFLDTYSLWRAGRAEKLLYIAGGLRSIEDLLNRTARSTKLKSASIDEANQ